MFFFTSISRSTFRTVCEVCCWINLIVCAYYGHVIGNAMGQARAAIMMLNVETAGHAFLGLVVGAGIGLVSSIIFGGFVAAILDIDENTRLAQKGKLPSEDNANILPQIVRQPIIVPEGAVTQAQCKNCSKMLSCEKSFDDNEMFFDENSCCDKHEFFRG